MNHLELSEHLKTPKLYSVAKNLLQTALRAEDKKLSYEQFLAELIHVEIIQRSETRKKLLLAQSKINSNKCLESYDYNGRKGVSAQLINRLKTGEWLRQASNIVLYGDIGVGKTHLAVGLVRSLCELGFRCLYLPTNKLVEELSKSKRDLDLGGHFKRLDKFDLLVCDELGYIPQNQEGGELFFQLIAHRYERKSILITTNLPYSEWGKVFHNPVTTAAAVDRIIHHCETINITGKSGRQKYAEVSMQESLSSN